jgi:ATP-dependent Clp protease ATP-binding subunit ClpC
VIQILCRRTANNPLLVGEPGVGKTAIVHGLAQRIASGNVPQRLKGKRLLTLDLSPLVAISPEGGQLEARVMAVLNELLETANLIVYVQDPFVTWSASGSANSVNLLKPLLVQGEIQCVAATTPAEYPQAIEKEAWLQACFHAVEVPPPNEGEAIEILRGIKQRYEHFHSLTYTDEAVNYAVYCCRRYFPDRALPGKAIDLIDDAATVVALRSAAMPEEVIDVQKRIKFIVHRAENAIAKHEFEKARFYFDEKRKEQENLRQLIQKYNIDTSRTTTVGVDELEEAVARLTGLPISTIRQERDAFGLGEQGGQAQ